MTMTNYLKSQYYVAYEGAERVKDEVISTAKAHVLHSTFKRRLLDMPAKVRADKPEPQLPPRRSRVINLKQYYRHQRHHLHHHHNNNNNHHSHDDDDEHDGHHNHTDGHHEHHGHHDHHDHHQGHDFESDSDLDSGSGSDNDISAFAELERKQAHPYRLHPELWYNDTGEMNDGPVCRCSVNARKTGIRHGIYPGEEHLESCDPHSNNADRLFHYILKIEPMTNYMTNNPTRIRHNSHNYDFEGFSLLSHSKLENLTPCKIIRFNIEYTITLVPEKVPDNFTVEALDMIYDYLFTEILELVDLDWKAADDDVGCPRFHLYPRFCRIVNSSKIKEILSIDAVLSYLISEFDLLINEPKLYQLKHMSKEEWLEFTTRHKNMIVMAPGMKPSSLRVDRIDCDDASDDVCTKSGKPVIVHFGSRPPQLSYAGNPNYHKAWKDLLKFRHLLANKPKVSFEDRQTLLQKEERLQEMKGNGDMKRDTTVVVDCEKFYTTGLLCDVVQHAMLMPVIVCHIRFHQSLDRLEAKINYQFRDRYLLQLALTHPSYRENYGTNADHARNVLTNCGIRQLMYGDKRIHFQNTRKRGINMLINIMSRFGCREETMSNINHNERLEFLGDAVVEFLSSIHLFFIFPDLEEGGLATYRAALVQNQHLAVLAKKLELDRYMLYAHGSDLCHDLELRHAMANCFEALMAALFLDGNTDIADQVFANVLFGDDQRLLKIWTDYPKHPLQQQNPSGDRHLIKDVPRLQKLIEFEELTGLKFNHIRLLARAFTHRSIGFNNLTLGTNQRMEFLGDTVLQLIASQYLYKYFPGHHEGHLSLLRSSLVNNRTQSVVCDDLGMTEFAFINYIKGELKTKDRADLLEALLGALYVDKGLDICRVFCQVCFFPRLQDFIIHQNWNDPKSKLQQCCLTLRSLDNCEPDIPIYKVIETIGPTNTRVYRVAVYFRDRRLAKGDGHSIQEAEMAAATNALDQSADLFPQLDYQKKVLERLNKNPAKRPRLHISSSSSSNAMEY